ncbi:MAG: hypothetical protein FJ087_08970 [Deltaproteobacteria bacterium]|nr:hypothetical protein [Deltaproteobacteria bacterium]
MGWIGLASAVLLVVLAGAAPAEARPLLDAARLSSDTIPPPLGPFDRTLLVQLELLAGLVLLASRWRTLAAHARHVPRAEWLVVAAISAAGLALRLLGGNRIPGFINGHGYSLVADLLHSHLAAYDPHLNGLDALHGLSLAVLPRTEASILALQLACSVLAIPACWAFARLFARSPAVGLWAAAVLAVLPYPVSFALTEVHMVPGALFASVTLALAGIACREPEPDLPLLIAIALLCAVASQFQPIMLVFPAVVLAFTAADPGGRALLRSPRAWIAAGLLLVLWIEPAWVAVGTVVDQRGPAGGLAANLARWADALVPTLGGAGAAWTGNAFLNARSAPPTFAALALAGVAAALATPGRRLLALAVPASAMLLTVPGMNDRFVNCMRHQLAAAPLWAMLAALALARVQDVASSRLRRGREIAALGGALLLAASVAAWPGRIGQRFTPQLELDLVREGVRAVPSGCAIVVPFRPPVVPALPYYVSTEEDLDQCWLRRPVEDAAALAAAGRCVAYYRPAICYDFGTIAPPHGGVPADGLRPECRDFEAALELDPILVSDVPALPDHVQAFSRESLRIGFFRVSAPRGADASAGHVPPPGSLPCVNAQPRPAPGVTKGEPSEDLVAAFRRHGGPRPPASPPRPQDLPP